MLAKICLGLQQQSAQIGMGNINVASAAACKLMMVVVSPHGFVLQHKHAAPCVMVVM
jgi:hypothetical protein